MHTDKPIINKINDGLVVLTGGITKQSVTMASVFVNCAFNTKCITVLAVITLCIISGTT